MGSAVWSDETAKNPVLGRIAKHKVFYLFLLPAIASVIIFNYLPMIGVIMAFQNFDIISGGFFRSPFVGLAQFQSFLGSPDFHLALRNTIVINLLIFLIGFPLPIIFALLLNELRLRIFKRVVQTITYLPHFINFVVIGVLVYRFLDVDTGLVNELIRRLGGDPIAFMREPKYFWGLITSVSVWKELGWNSIIYIAALTAIDPHLYEAAMVDGAGRWQRLLHVTLPGIAPTIGLLLILSMGHLVGGGSFEAVFNLGNAMVSERSMTIDMYTYVTGIRRMQYSYAAAVGLFQSAISLGLVVLANGLSRKFKGYGAF